MINSLQFLRNSPQKLSARRPFSKIVIGIIALAIPLALAGTYMLSGGGALNDYLPGRSALSAGPGASAVNGGAANGLAARLGAVGSNLLKALGLRSPGERSQGELADSKGGPTRHKSSSIAPHQRALAKVRPPAGVLEQPFAPVTDNEVTSAAVTNALTPGPVVGAPGSSEQFVPGTNPGFGGGPGGGFTFPGAPSGGVVVPSPPPPLPPVTAAVPEPSTWALMLMGFWGIGASLRSNHRKSRRRFGMIKAVATQ